MRPTAIAAASIALLLPAAARAQGVPFEDPLGIVRLHVVSPAPVRLRAHTGRIVETHYGNVAITQYEALQPICDSPCDLVIDGRFGREFSLTVTNDAFPDPPPFMLWKYQGPLTVRVIPGNTARLVAGRVMTFVGGIGAIIGLGTLLVAASSSGPNDGKLILAGAVLGPSAGLLVAGIPLWASSTTTLRFEPRGVGLGLSLHTGAF